MHLSFWAARNLTILKSYLCSLCTAFLIPSEQLAKHYIFFFDDPGVENFFSGFDSLTCFWEGVYMQDGNPVAFLLLTIK